MRKKYDFYVYLMASESGTLYAGITNDIARRTSEHKEGKIEGFSQKYHCTKLVYYEHHLQASDAIAREKQIKRWRRSKKEFLIRLMNPHWKDLSENF